MKILCFGDSLTAGYCFEGSNFYPYGHQLQSLGEVDINGMSGWTTEDMIDHSQDPETTDFCRQDGKGLEVLLTEKAYDWVFILAGTNDLGNDVGNEEIFSNLCRLVDMSIGAGVKNVGVLTVPAFGGEWKFAEAQRARIALNAAIGDLASRYSTATNVHGIDICDVLPNGKQDSFKDAAVAALWDDDKLHFSKAGSAKLGQFLHQFIWDHQVN